MDNANTVSGAQAPVVLSDGTEALVFLPAGGAFTLTPPAQSTTPLTLHAINLMTGGTTPATDTRALTVAAPAGKPAAFWWRR